MDDRQKKFRETTEELAQFFRRVGQIWLYEELTFLGLDPDCPSGKYRLDRLHLLQEFCARETGYHIISCKDYRIYNKLIPNAKSYYLADGDVDPNLMVNLLSRLTADEFLQVGHTMLAPIVGDVKRSG
jgi:hypothetical protein